MPITVTYKLAEPKLKEATRLANQLLASEDLIRVIQSREKPFDESDPRDLSPSRVAEFVRNSTLEVTLCEYTNNNANVGGMFYTGTPTRIHANRKAVPRRSECNLARMLVHECIHALSYNVKPENFSHDSVHPSSAHGDTAPYWIQAKLKPFCKREGDEDVLEVDVITDAGLLESQDIKCG